MSSPSSGYTILKADYRDKGVYADMLEIFHLLATMQGRHGTLGRAVAVPSGAYPGVKRYGKFIIGTIPDSYQTGGVWVDELVTFEDLRDFQASLSDVGSPRLLHINCTTYSQEEAQP